MGATGRVHNEKVAKRPPDDDDALEVIDLFTDEPVTPGTRHTRNHDRDPGAGDERPPRRRRNLVIALGVLVLVVASVTVAVTRDGRSGGDASVGLASKDGAKNRDDRTGTSTVAAPATLPEVRPPAWLALGGRFALGLDGQLVLVDGTTGNADAPAARTDGRATVTSRGAGRVLVRRGLDATVADPRGGSTDASDGLAFPAVDGEDWWIANPRTVSPLIGTGPTARLPSPELRALAAVRAGFLLQPLGVPALYVWTPGQALRALTQPLVETSQDDELSIVATHPDRVAWQIACPASACGVHVTDVASGRDVMLPGGILPFFDSGRAYGRFSPDGRYLGLHVATNLAGPGALVLVDLTTGSVVARRDIQVRFSSTGADTSAAAPFDFTPDSGHLVVADWSTRPGRLDVLRTADGGVEHTIDGVGRVDSIASFDAAPIVPSTPLFAAPTPAATTGALAIISQNGDTLTTVDIGTGRQRVVHLSNISLGSSDDTLPRLVALEGGFAWIRAGEAWFASATGDLVSLGLADHVLPGRTPAEAWTVRRSDSGYEIMRVDGRTGARGMTYESAVAPEGAVRDGLVIGRPASFTQGSSFEVWNPVTARARTVPLAVPARSPIITAAGDTRVIWYDQSCANGGSACTTYVTDLSSGRTDPLPTNTFPYAGSSLTPAGARVYVQVQDDNGTTHLTAIDLRSMAAETVPGSEGIEQWAVSSRDFLVFQTDAIYLWVPGWPAAALLSPGTVGLVGGFAVR
jgi:hypothetical protein